MKDHHYENTLVTQSQYVFIGEVSGQGWSHHLAHTKDLCKGPSEI